ncbi:MAG: thermonuclease family protein [Saprospiraceae bacterium]|nr:thermonuclease family protein [Pyrinomonadaceae bacterium]
MLLKILYLVSILCVGVSPSYFQTTASTQTDKQKIAVVVPSAILDEAISLIEGRVILIYDGDNIGVRGKDRKIYSIRLQGIDAPEEKQPYGKKARKKLAELVSDKDVKVIVHKKDIYDRYVGSVYADGLDIGLKQIENGMAWHFKRFSGEQSAESRVRYSKAELKARTDRNGLWSETAPIPPWEFRDEVFVESAVAMPPVQKPVEKVKSDVLPAASPSKAAGRTYIMGPRGGCYYLGDAGNKVYVKDKTLCSKQ